MASTTVVSVEEYLRTSYDPDCDYIDGEIQERNLGEKPHSKLQVWLGAWPLYRSGRTDLHVFPEQRVRVSPTRFRIPDICVYVGQEPEENVFITPPFLCIEILSTEDRLSRIKERLDDYVRMGVPNIWLIDPQPLTGWIYRDGSLLEQKDGILRTQNPEIAVPLKEVTSR